MSRLSALIDSLSQPLDRWVEANFIAPARANAPANTHFGWWICNDGLRPAITVQHHRYQVDQVVTETVTHRLTLNGWKVALHQSITRPIPTPH